MNPLNQEDVPIITIPARRNKPERETAEKRGHDKVSSGRKTASKKIIEQEADDAIRQALRLGSSTEVLENE